MSTTASIYKSARLGEFAEMLSGYDDIAQSIGVILRTQKGSVPLEPLYGVDHLKYIDRPIEQIRGQYAAEIAEALSLWEPRASISGVVFGGAGVEVTVTVRWSPRNVDMVRTDVFSLGV